MRIKIALVLMSAIFMSYWVMFLFSLMSITTTLNIFSDDFSELMSIVSFLGSALFLLEARKILSRWYLAVPLFISLFLLVIVNFWIIFSGKDLLSEPISAAEILRLLLPSFSVLVFLALQRHPDSMIVYLAVSCVASLLSMIFIFHILQSFSRSSNSLTIYLMVINWACVMPITGLCFLASAIIYTNPGNILSPVTVGSTQNQS